eukprot:12929360-Prorocentrum_lima.AAC.1
MQEQGRAVVVHCRDSHCHEQQQVRVLLDEGNVLLHTVLSCNIGLTHKQSSRPIKLKKRVITAAGLPQLDHSRTYEHNEIHAQAN